MDGEGLMETGPTLRANIPEILDEENALDFGGRFASSVHNLASGS